MSTQAPSLWTRIVGSFKFRGRDEDADPQRAGGSEEPFLTQPVHWSGLEQPASDKGNGPLTRWSRREQTLAQLQEGYEKVTQLTEEIRNHLVQQGERGERMCASLEHLARALGDHPAVSRQQAETLEAIASQIETTNQRVQKVSEALNDVPTIARSQNEALDGMCRQLEIAGEQQTMNAQTMEKVGTVLNALSEASASQARALNQANDKTNQQNELLTQLIATQSKRFSMLFVVTVVLAVTAVASVIAGLLLRPGVL